DLAESDAGGLLGIAGDETRLDVLVVELRQHRIAARVAADARHQRDLRAETRRTDGLVRSFASCSLLARVAADGLAGRRQPRAADQVVDVRLPHDHDVVHGPGV